MAHTLGWLAIIPLVLLPLAGCDSGSQPQQRPLALPERLEKPHVTDQAQAGGLHLALWDDGGGCKLQVGQTEPSIWLKPMAPCYFMLAAGGQRAQVFRHNKTTLVMAVLGTPAKGKHCGQEVQGLIINGGVKPSTYIMQGSVYCAEQGLQNFQYDLLAK
ncbi:hypothetical protein [Thiothrix nivea]|uniref:Uncharacterized protein n=1 Tax=Thiothrix nivea (strain ATCC 35100 / DSM 5205 / JP2) TaxID=870187 RepID=A0A656HG46_THINJ|nr:hypothetical protein [Thiothrix nivea]EIJ35878.1 hypothetical protein Thini_3363 [Thiothrix nivea DSM 5205]